MRAAIYVRISDDREGRELGVERQRADCEALAARDGLTVVGTFADNDISASVKSKKVRPEYARMLADARAGRIKVIVAYTSSRLTRRPREVEDLLDLAQEHGVEFRYVRSPSFDLSTAAGRRIARTLAAQDAGEAEDVSERVKRDVVRRAQAGVPHGGPKGYGVTADGRHLVPAEARRIRAWAKHIRGGGTLTTLAVKLNKDGVPSPGGKQWKPMVIRRILLAPRVAGLRIVDGAEYQTPHPPILKPDVWRALVRTLTDPARRVHDRGPARRHLGVGLYVCDRCDRTVGSTYHADGYRTYRCMGCWRTWRGAELDEFVISMTEAALVDEDRRARLIPDVAGVDLAELRDEAAAIAANIKAMSIEAGKARTAAGRAGFMAGIAEAEERLVEVERQLADAGRSDALAAVISAKDPIRAWRSLDDLGRRQTVIRGLMSIRLGAPRRGRVPWSETFLGESRWTGDPLRWADHWS